MSQLEFATTFPNDMTKLDYLEIISTITEPKTKDERFKLHLATSYIRENVKNLNEADLKQLLDNEIFMKKVGADFEKNLTNRYEKFNMQSFDNEKCIQIFANNNQPTKESKLNFHLALSYFKANVVSFTKEELRIIFSSNYVKKNIGKKFDSEIMNQCIDHNKNFPLYSIWEVSSFSREKIEAYIEIIHNEGNQEQLKFFCETKTSEIGDYITKKGKVSPLLEELYITVNPAFIYQINWSEEKACAWLDENKNLIPTLFNSFYLYQNNFSPKFENKIYEVIKDELLSSDLALSQYKINILQHNRSKLVEYLHKNHSSDLKDILAQPFIETYPLKTELNIAQQLISSILIDEQYSDINKLYEIICENKDLLLKPIKVEDRLYEKEISIFEYSLINTKFLGFIPFNLNSVTEPIHKEQIVAAAFCLLQVKHNAFELEEDEYIQNFKTLQKWYPQIIEQATSEQVIRYADRALRGHEDNSKLSKELKTLKLKAELHQDLEDNNSTPTKKIKL